MERRKRDEKTHWLNDQPITDEHEALFVLQREWQGPFPIYLSMVNPDRPEVCLEMHRPGDGGRTSSCYIEYLEIDSDLARRLIAQLWVVPMRIPHSGYTETVQDKFVLSRPGGDRLQALTQEKLQFAKTLPVPGEHTKFSSLFEEVRYGREHGRRGGRFFVDYKTPMDERLRVFPDSKEIQKGETPVA